ncbi:hypothetical protein [Nocardioides speluncae]|uniref:hypothetical protein n=1 Tax=Nocardioides speluncae TaxID=2670337 RepID=UPI000D68FE8E|nr:hypothetical protein [Nocardioides speluncae]
MTEHTLRDTLNDIAGDITGPDLVDRAWADATRRRRRTQLAAVGAIAASVAVIAGGAAVIGGTPDAAPGPSHPPSSTRSPSGSPSPLPSGQSQPDARTDEGDPVWFSPSVPEEPSLQWATQSVLPRTIDAGDVVHVGVGSGSAVAVVLVGDLSGEYGPTRAVVVDRNGSHTALDIGRLEPAQDQDGNGAAPLPAGLSPDGRHVAFTQNSSIEVYEFASAQWQSVDTPDWLAEGATWLDNETLWVPDVLEGEVGSTYALDGRQTARDVPKPGGKPEDGGYGPTKSNSAGWHAQSNYQVSAKLRPRESVGFEALVVRRGEQRRILAYWPPYEGEGRGVQCCMAVGWLDEETVAYQSGDRVLAWKLGADSHFQVAEITGVASGDEWYVATWADLDR